MEGSTNLPILFVSWWYSYAYRRLFKYIRAVYILLFDLFSVRLALGTLFSPWKRDVISYEGLSLQQKFEVFSLNLASRFVGFVIKTVDLIIYLATTCLVSAISLAVIIVWPLYPIVFVYFIYLGIKLII